MRPASDSVLAPTRVVLDDMELRALNNLEYEQEICDNISSYGREKYLQFVAIIRKDRRAFTKTLALLESRFVRKWFNVATAVGTQRLCVAGEDPADLVIDRVRRQCCHTGRVNVQGDLVRGLFVHFQWEPGQNATLP